VILVHRAPAKRLMKARPRPKRLACVVEFLDGKLAVHRAMSAALAAYEARNPTQPRRNLAPAEHTREVTDCAVTPREDLVELRGVELQGNILIGATEDELLALPSSGRGRR